MSRRTSNHNIPDGILDIKDEKDNTIITHVRRVDGIIKDNQEIKREYAWNKKGWRLRARVDPLVFFDKPELLHDQKAMKKWLRTEEAKPWLITSDKMRTK